jgi:hypothetical protein
MQINHFGILGEQTICYQNNFNMLGSIDFSYYYSSSKDIIYDRLETTVAKFILKYKQNVNTKKK